jgi:hypothetical protein
MKCRMTTEQMQATLDQLHQAMTGSVSAAAHASAVVVSGCTCERCAR